MNRDCPHCHCDSSFIRKHGHFVRNSDKKSLLRFRCLKCHKSFSQATSQQNYYQKLRKLHPRILELFCSGISQRRMALLLKISRTTVARKLVILAQTARLQNQQHLQCLPRIAQWQFDDLETIEHTKLKPLSVTMAVEKHTRFILGFRVSQMPAKGLLAKKSRKKYGHREDLRAQGREELFLALKPHIAPYCEISSDESPHYPHDVKKHFPKAIHSRFKGQRGCVVGQGELKAGGFDPLFSLNHTYAMLRANINRLFRRTWCTTKCPERLKDHLELYVQYHNQFLLKNPTRC